MTDRAEAAGPVDAGDTMADEVVERISQPTLPGHMQPSLLERRTAERSCFRW